MTKSMAANHGTDGIRVNCVCPGFLYTPMVAAEGMTEAARESRRMQSLLQTEGNAWDSATAARFLAGGEARWITGTILTVDAGVSSSFYFPKL
ncbi:putative oxidoreductase YxbG [Cladobotryum mycophilum]|uniref:Oxidoreductase YxbG n=1 Tax=Cladobotryum mycophilum TaxID=491253 RepID=A0ABR0SJY0_9HYPO